MIFTLQRFEGSDMLLEFQNGMRCHSCPPFLTPEALLICAHPSSMHFMVNIEMQFLVA
jgi:hypothetical protein